MESDDDKELDWEVATDEESLKIRALQHELRSVSTSEDKKLFIWLGCGLAAILLYAIKPHIVTQWLVFIAIPVSIVGGIGSTIVRNIRKTKTILISHGLRCDKCGFIPNKINASGVLIARKCLKCQNKLEAH